MRTRERPLARSVPAALRSPGDSFYLLITSAMTCTVFLGFSFTYFGPLMRGGYPEVSPLVHVHGWTFLAWYVLLPVQAGLIRSGRPSLHRALGLCSTALGALMVSVGLIVSVVQIELASRPGGSPFWQLMGLPIFAVWLLFTGFYVEAIRRRRRVDQHKRLILLASAVGLSAATFRIVVRVVGFGVPSAFVGVLVCLIFPLIGVLRDRQRGLPVHAVHAWGVTLSAVTIAAAFLLAAGPGAGMLEQRLAWLGSVLMPLYLAPPV